MPSRLNETPYLDRLVQAALLLLASLYILTIGMLGGAGFVTDDWYHLTLAVHGGGPAQYLLELHSPTYAYRPAGVISWWLGHQLFGLWAGGHYLINVSLHAGIAMIAGLLARRISGMGWPPMLAVLVLLSVHPAMVGTSLWLSNRFDLLLSLSALALMWQALAFPRRVALPMLAGLMLLAAASKELAFALFLPALLLLLKAHLGPRQLIPGVLALAAPLILYLTLRYQVLGSFGGVIAADPGGASMLDGVLLWWRYLPLALTGQFGASGTPATLITGALVSTALLLIPLACLLCKSPDLRRWTLATILALGAISVLQAPVTRLVFSNELALTFQVNYRFYHLATALLAINAAAAMASLLAHFRDASAQRTSQLLVTSMLLALLAMPGCVWLLRSQTQIENWVLTSASEHRLQTQQALWLYFSELSIEPPCQLQVLGGEQLEPDLAGFGDWLIKAGLPPGSDSLNCIVYSEHLPWFAGVGRDAAPAYASLPARRSDGMLLSPRPAGPLVLLYPGEMPAGVGHAVFRIDNGSIHREWR